MRLRLYLTAFLGSAVCAAMILAAPIARAATVSGSFVYQDGKPAAQRQLHFENRVSGDMYIAPTGADGKYQVELPPGVYDLRAERGLVLKSDIVVNTQNLDLGTARAPTLFDPRRPFEREGVGEDIVKSDAPATANVAGRPAESMKFGHKLVQMLWGPAKPLPPLPAAGSTPTAEATNGGASALAKP